MHAASYLRVSSSAQGEGTSLTSQREAVEAYAAAAGIELVAIESDEWTGRTTTRAGLQRLLELARAGAFSILIATKVDRLSRRAWQGLQLEEEFGTCGVRVVYTDQAFSPDPAGRFLRTTLGAVAELESDHIRERTYRGRVARAKERQVCPGWSRPYGLRQVTAAEAQAIPEYAGRTGEYLVVEEEAAAVRELFTRYADGASLASLTAWLQATVPTLRGGRWSAKRVRLLLANPIYTGHGAWAKRECRRVGDTRIVTPRPEAEWIRTVAPAIVDVDLWTAVQSRLTRERSTGRGRPPVHPWPLRGVVWCAVCDRRCRGKANRCRGHTYRWYLCVTPGCRTRGKAETLEELALAYLLRLAEGELVRAYARALKRQAKDDTASADHERAAALLAAIDADATQLLRQATRGFPGHIVDAELASLRQRRTQAEAILADARARLAAREALGALLERGRLTQQELAAEAARLGALDIAPWAGRLLVVTIGAGEVRIEARIS